MGVRLDFEEKSDGSHDQGVHDERGGEGGEFGREGVHGCLPLVVVIDPYPHNTARDVPVAALW
jgi:hypothetical protein